MTGILQDSLELRSRRLVSLVENSAPKPIIGREVVLVLEAAMGYCPKEVSDSFEHWLSTDYEETFKFRSN